MKPRVFISHSSIDTWVAQQIAAQIRDCGADTFLDEADIQHGDDFEEEILKAEAMCAELLVLVTPWSLERHYVWMEIAFFRRGGKRIVAALHGVTPKAIATDERIAVLLKKLDLVELNNITSYFAQLKTRVEKLEANDA
jgi:hypothetical protein